MIFTWQFEITLFLPSNLMWFDLRENRKKKSKQSEDDSTQQGREEGDEIEEEQNEQGIKVHKHVHLFYLLLKRNVLISTCKLYFVKHQTIFSLADCQFQSHHLSSAGYQFFNPPHLHSCFSVNIWRNKLSVLITLSWLYWVHFVYRNPAITVTNHHSSSNSNYTNHNNQHHHNNNNSNNHHRREERR